MKKIVAFLLIVAVLSFAANAFAEDSFVQQQNLGKDRAGLQWWLVGFGVTTSGYYAVAREYYTNEAAKAEVTNTLSARHGVPYDRLSNLYFAEFRFEYTADGSQYTEVSRVFYDKLGDEICAYSTGHKVFNPVIPNTVQSKGAAYAMGRIR